MKKTILAGLILVIGSPVFADPIHDSVEEGNLPQVVRLLNSGANVNATNKDGETPLHSVVKQGHPEIPQALIDAGANVNSMDA